MTVNEPIRDLEMQLQAQMNGRVRCLQVLLLPEGIVLRGLAPNYHAKQIAQHVVMRLTRLPIRSNDIEVSSDKEGS